MALSCCKKLSALFRGITSKRVGGFYCLNCFHSYRKENKLKKHEKIRNNHDYCYVEVTSEDNKILKYNREKKSIKPPFIIYAELECLLEKMHSCQNNPEKSSKTKINMHPPSGYSLFTNYSLDSAKSKPDCYKDKDCMEIFCKNLKEHATKMINYKKNEMIPLTDEENKSFEKQKAFYICKKKSSDDYDNEVSLNKKYYKVRDLEEQLIVFVI